MVDFPRTFWLFVDLALRCFSVCDPGEHFVHVTLRGLETARALVLHNVAGSVLFFCILMSW